jgi:hypothetical protein
MRVRARSAEGVPLPGQPRARGPALDFSGSPFTRYARFVLSFSPPGAPPLAPGMGMCCPRSRRQRKKDTVRIDQARTGRAVVTKPASGGWSHRLLMRSRPYLAWLLVLAVLAGCRSGQPQPPLASYRTLPRVVLHDSVVTVPFTILIGGVRSAVERLPFMATTATSGWKKLDCRGPNPLGTCPLLTALHT